MSKIRDCPKCGAPCQSWDNHSWGENFISYMYVEPDRNLNLLKEKNKEIHKLKSELGRAINRVKRLEEELYGKTVQS